MGFSISARRARRHTVQEGGGLSVRSLPCPDQTSGPVLFTAVTNHCIVRRLRYHRDILPVATCIRDAETEDAIKHGGMECSALPDALPDEDTKNHNQGRKDKISHASLLRLDPQARHRWPDLRILRRASLPNVFPGSGFTHDSDRRARSSRDRPGMAEGQR